MSRRVALKVAVWALCLAPLEERIYALRCMED